MKDAETLWFAGRQGNIFPGTSVWVADLPEGRVYEGLTIKSAFCLILKRSNEWGSSLKKNKKKF